MKKTNRIRNILLISFAVIFVATVGIGEAWAYFTTYAQAKGGTVIQLGSDTEIHEKVSNWEKTIWITNGEESNQAVYVRAKAITDSEHELTYTSATGKWVDGRVLKANGASWIEGDIDESYWYYTEIVPPKGGSTDELVVGIIKDEDPKDGYKFNVVVLYESVPVRYRMVDGIATPYADWNAKLLDSDVWKGGNE